MVGLCCDKQVLGSYPGLVPRPRTQGPRTQASYPGLVPRPRTQASYPGLVPRPRTQASYPGLVPGPRTRASYPGLVPGPRTRASYPGLVPGPRTQASQPSICHSLLTHGKTHCVHIWTSGGHLEWCTFPQTCSCGVAQDCLMATTQSLLNSCPWSSYMCIAACDEFYLSILVLTTNTGVRRPGYKAKRVPCCPVVVLLCCVYCVHLVDGCIPLSHVVENLK